MKTRNCIFVNLVIIICILLCTYSIEAQVISTYAIGSQIYDPNQIAFDKYGNLYCATNIGNTILKIDSGNLITVFAGTGIAGYNGDGGPATLAELYEPNSIAIDTFGNVYISDVGNNRIRKVDITSGTISTIAGTGYGAPTSGNFSGDGGPATLADLFYPDGIQFDAKGNIYICDYRNSRIRKVDTHGIISTIAGNGIAGSLGDGNQATDAECIPNYNICIDVSNNLYFIDFGNYTVRKIDSFGIITTFAGDSTGLTIYAGDNVTAIGAPIAPLAIVLDQSSLLVIADGNNRIRRIDSFGIIHTIAGNGLAGDSGDGGQADSAELYTPAGIAYDKCGNLYIAQVDEPRIRKVTFDSTCTYRTTKVPQLPNNELVIYPNPATEELHIDGIKYMEKYRLLNIKNNIEQEGNLEQGSNTINIQQLPPGMYFLEMIDDKGYKEVKKVVKD